MKSIIRGGCVLLLLMTACDDEQKTTQKLFNFEQLINDQIEQLAHRKAVLEKTVRVGGEPSDSTFSPSTKGWEAELEVFRQMETFNKPIYRTDYILNDPLKDTQSNLSIRQYSSDRAPISMVKFYYHGDISQLKKIEAKVGESNILFSSSRELVMEFEEDHGKPVLQRYVMSGFQKMIFRDTVRFSLVGQIGH